MRSRPLLDALLRAGLLVLLIVMLAQPATAQDGGTPGTDEPESGAGDANDETVPDPPEADDTSAEADEANPDENADAGDDAGSDEEAGPDDGAAPNETDSATGESNDEPETPPRARRGRHSEPWTQEDKTLRDDGWEFREKDRSPGSVACGLWAILVSTVWHGYGHYCADDSDSHEDLLIMEGIAVGLWAAGFTIAVVSNDADALTPVSSGMYYAGAVLFVSSYLFDLLGTFKGSSRELSTNQRNADGFEPRMMLRWVPTDPFNLTLIAGIELPIRYGLIWFVPDAMLDVSGLNYWRAAGDLGVKVWQGDSRATYLALGNETRFEQFTSLGFEVLTTVPWVEFSMDIGSFLPHLAGLHFSNRLGYGFEFYSWDAVKTNKLFKDRTSLFVLESALSLNILDQFNLALTYRQRPDLLIGGLSQSTRIFDLIKVPGAGILGFELDFETENAWKVDFEVNVGTLVEFWLAFGKRF